MTENEAKEYMENEVRCIKQASHCDSDCLKCGLVKEEQPLLESFAVAIQALEEIQQYRAIGTVEEIQQKLKNMSLVIDTDRDLLNRYIAIGTIDEFKALKEKNEPKKAIILDRRCENGDEVCVEWKCPVCGLNVIEEPPCQEYCQRCGNKLDWSE